MTVIGKIIRSKQIRCWIGNGLRIRTTVRCIIECDYCHSLFETNNSIGRNNKNHFCCREHTNLSQRDGVLSVLKKEKQLKRRAIELASVEYRNQIERRIYDAHGDNVTLDFSTLKMWV